jgi:hypothetical protein
MQTGKDNIALAIGTARETIACLQRLCTLQL